MTQQRHPLPPGPLPVIMEDPITHTVQRPTCLDASCICHPLEALQAQEDHPKRRQIDYKPTPGWDAPLNGNRQFRLLR
ncbi:MAG TPA: hypothetical protein VKR06_02410 [Ktedonosporobacter sp.]|nr:hypothetical protein [Ktedonosporobacter sp.]